MAAGRSGRSGQCLSAKRSGTSITVVPTAILTKKQTLTPDEQALYRAAWAQPGALTGGLDAGHGEIRRAVGPGAAALVPVANRMLRFPLS